jgi:tRNA threonylcarbamoyladenosine biosynthesis protein TsaE
VTASAPRPAPSGRSAADSPTSGVLETASAAETRRVGSRLGRAAAPGTCLALVGPLGAGKTQLAKGVADGLGVRSVVNSPTFIIVNEHAGRLPLFHVDAYRLTDADEARQAGVFDERQVTGVTVIEWADRLDGWLPADRLDLEIEPDPAAPDRRNLAWRATGPRHAELARVLESGRKR